MGGFVPVSKGTDDLWGAALNCLCGKTCKPVAEVGLMKITDGGLDDPRVQAMLAHHFHTARADLRPVARHAMDLSGLKSPEIRFWSIWEDDQLLGVGALNAPFPE